MKLPGRLMAVTEFVRADSIVADIGTDHALLPVFLISNNFCKRAYAADIRQGPLMSATKNIALYGLCDKIETVLCDGLMKIPRDRKSVV